MFTPCLEPKYTLTTSQHHALDAGLASLDPIICVSWLNAFLMSSLSDCWSRVAGRWLRRFSTRSRDGLALVDSIEFCNEIMTLCAYTCYPIPAVWCVTIFYRAGC
jgi:hypothetical protein